MIEEVKKILDSVTTSRQYGYITAEDKEKAAQQICRLFEPKPDRLLTEDEIVAYSTKDGEYCQLAVDVGIWARDKTASEKDAECQERVEGIFGEIETSEEYKEYGWPIEELIEALKKKEGVK